jgi:hypothetical protein
MLSRVTEGAQVCEFEPGAAQGPGEGRGSTGR